MSTISVKSSSSEQLMAKARKKQVKPPVSKGQQKKANNDKGKGKRQAKGKEKEKEGESEPAPASGPSGSGGAAGSGAVPDRTRKAGYAFMRPV